MLLLQLVARDLQGKPLCPALLFEKCPYSEAWAIRSAALHTTKDMKDEKY